MIILDTNIISEMMKQTPSMRVIAWMDTQEVMQLFITTITIAEISYGLNALPLGNRRNKLEDAFNNAIMDAFRYRILPFDETAALCYGKLMGSRKNLGQPLGILDGQIAAIAQAHEATVATRNINDFRDYALVLVNPFDFETTGSDPIA